MPKQKKKISTREKQYGYYLYILTDKKPEILHSWLNKHDVYPTAVTKDIDTIYDALLYSTQPVLVIVLQTGSKYYASTTYIKQVAEQVISVANNSTQKYVTILYRDELLKNTIIDAAKQHIKGTTHTHLTGVKTDANWSQYMGAYSIIETLNATKGHHYKGKPCNYKVDIEALLNRTVPKTGLEGLELKDYEYPFVPTDLILENMREFREITEKLSSKELTNRYKDAFLPSYNVII